MTMTNKKAVIAAILGLSLFLGCTEESPLISNEDLIVVWAYLYVGEPVTSVKLTSTVPLDVDTTEAPPINDAVITLIKHGQRYECEPSPGDSGYYHYSDNDLTIETGDQFKIEIEYKDQFVTGTTVVPLKPVNVAISSLFMTIPDFSNMESLWEWRQSENREIEITWDNEDDSWYYVTLENIDENPVEISSLISGGPLFQSRPARFIFPPINDNSYRIRLPLITHLGLHRVNLYRVNQEYVNLYESRQQDSRDLNEPLTNIENGLGVFSAFNSESVYLDVTLP